MSSIVIKLISTIENIQEYFESISVTEQKIDKFDEISSSNNTQFYACHYCIHKF